MRRGSPRDSPSPSPNFDSGRLELQRTTEWLRAELEVLAAERSDLLSARRDEGGTVRFRILPLPR
ncbi:hypothetical protein ACFVG1_34670 [Streptomyces bacillaris]|uniref:hypothetical protein n=1 Tax=Streptomyces bacillaris TaxID=68179 RepID=UPI00335EF82F